MKEIRLFEIGFKDKPHSAGYSYKFYVAARDGEEAIKKGRKWLIEDHLRWWNESGRVIEMAELVDAEIDEWIDGETDTWLEKRFAKSPPLQAALKKVEERSIEEIESMELARLHDTGTLII
ncbi:hypothetical protein LCGC14_2113580 [marine sediment metagenome]|uniref:Uncharacterized protein n=1 Tax=marine sediment metagenome TaxID=412755 RepID=A0A0F9E6F7_9ZZZZ